VTNVVQDGSFEAGSPNPVWDEKSTNFGTPLCDEASCGTGGGTAGPRTGAWWAWFGGTPNPEDGAVQQTVNIPAGAATLQFYLWIGAHSGNGTADYMRVLVGGTEVFRATDADTQYDNGYTLVTVNVSAQSGGSRVLRFEQHSIGGDVINFSLDDITLNAGGGCPTTVTPVVSTSTPTSIPTTAVPSVTSTPTTQVPSVTNTPVEPSSTPVEPSVTPTVCPMQFQDVPPGHTFYDNVRCLACRGIIGGYPCGGAGEPCGTTNNPYFRPNNDITRGQIAKIVSQSAGFSEPPGEQFYEDVPPASPFYQWINRLSNRGYIGGYQCGLVPEEPCIPPGNRPYFRPNAPATRGQLSKIVATAAQINDPVEGQTYTDVGPTSTFYLWIEQLSQRGVMGGYPCGTVPSEPCDSENRPYFRPNNNVTRGQASKIVSNTFFPNCVTPAKLAPSTHPHAKRTSR
jgi:hypothetical protein